MSTIPHNEAQRRVLAFSLGDAFAEALQRALNGAEWLEMRRRNALDPSAETCASHDFCDANMIMLDAFTALMGREPLHLEGTDAAGDWRPDQEADIDLWNRGWANAAQRHLTAQEGEPSQFERLTAEYEAWVVSHGYGEFRGDAEELLASGTLRSQIDGGWLVAFVEQWDEMEAALVHNAALYAGREG